MSAPDQHQSADAIVTERRHWNEYRDYVVQRSPAGQVTNFCGNAVSHGLWFAWKAAYDTRRAMSVPFTRRQRRWDYR